MNLLKAVGTIGGLTMGSRVLGFGRDMIGSRILGASHANDAFNFAFFLPNVFRRLFGEGAFASGFVPLFSRRLASGGHQDAQQFSNEILSVFMPTLLVSTLTPGRTRCRPFTTTRSPALSPVFTTRNPSTSGPSVTARYSMACSRLTTKTNRLPRSVPTARSWIRSPR